MLRCLPPSEAKEEVGTRESQRFETRRFPIAESTRQNPHTPGSETPRADQEGLPFAGLAEVTQIRKPSPPANTLGPGADARPAQGEERESGATAPTNLIGDKSKKERQITLLRDHVSALRRERDRKEATLLNQHIHRASAEHLRRRCLGSAEGRDPRGI